MRLSAAAWRRVTAGAQRGTRASAKLERDGGRLVSGRCDEPIRPLAIPPSLRVDVELALQSEPEGERRVGRMLADDGHIGGVVDDRDGPGHVSAAGRVTGPD